MIHQTVSLGKYRKLFPATLRSLQKSLLFVNANKNIALSSVTHELFSLEGAGFPCDILFSKEAQNSHIIAVILNSTQQPGSIL